ncbi:hypothetical protein K7W03_08585 [Sphingobium sp. PNB]|uniref:hypothetical protein n=1 Tax=Sphingobium sp. PNB TaxID=863934 RepID=UPI001CA45DF6|nr:hypothetical protein [Sphingobium sp. PNB]MCB4859655.1 hypothetical protein [Sphingobium sp. PNB]
MIQQRSHVVMRYAGRLRTALVLVLIGTAATEIWALCRELTALGAPVGAGDGSATSRRLTLGCDLLSGVAVSVGLFYLIRATGTLSRAGRMIPAATENLKGFAYCVLIAAASTSILPLVVVLLVRASEKTGDFQARVDGSDLLLLLVAGVLVPITRLLASANLAQEELDQIV